MIMATSTGGDRSETVASMLIALLEAKQYYPKGETATAKAEDMGAAFKVLYAAVAQAERDGSKGAAAEPLRM
jgi:hypothetical protein